jgi:hypothetical protein
MNLQEFMAATERLTNERPQLEQLVEQVKNRLKNAEAVQKALAGLRTCWNDGDPGKYGDHWFLVRDYEIDVQAAFRGVRQLAHVDKFWAIEAVDDPIEAQRGRKSRWSFEPNERHPVPLGKLADTKQEPCKHCQQPATLVGRYKQTSDGPFSGDDVWTLEVFTLCLQCVALEPVARRVEGGRFF